MIVRNESRVIQRCLESVRGLIDTWVICDTGSTDGTQELIREGLAGIPGELHQAEWVNFGHNRTELMELAHGKADYLLLIDADMTVRQTAALPRLTADPLPRLTADSYLLRQGNDVFDYRNKRLVRGDLRWRYVGSTHEYIECADSERDIERLDAVAIDDHGDGGSKHDKFERDRKLLEAELATDPANQRATFYLAQTYREIGLQTGDRETLELALGTYERRAEMGGWDEEVYCARHQAGILHDKLGDWPRAADAFIAAWESRPGRLEAVHDLAVGLIQRGQYRAAHQFTRLASHKPPPPQPDDILFVRPWIYRWGLLFQYSISAYWCGDYAASISACNKLLHIEQLPDEHRRQTVRNMEHALREQTRLAVQPPPTPRIWGHAGHPSRGRAAGSQPAPPLHR